MTRKPEGSHSLGANEKLAADEMLLTGVLMDRLVALPHAVAFCTIR